MKRIICLILLACVVLCCFSSCGGSTGSSQSGGGKQVSQAEIDSAKKTLNIEATNLSVKANRISMIFLSYDLCKNTGSSTKKDYKEACDAYDETIELMKNMIDRYEKYAKYLESDTVNSMKKLKEIYNDSVAKSQKTSSSNEKEYVSIIRSLANNISSWEYASASVESK